MKVLAIIPARAGSVGVPGKNTRAIYGKPLIAWSIECALAAKGLDVIVVSSDDERALDTARTYPEVMIRVRNPALAEETTPIVPVIADAVQAIELERSMRFDAILLLQPTAPLREPFHIEEALSALRPGVNSVISVCESRDMHPARMYRIDSGSVLSPIMPELEQARRQDIPPAYLRNGAIYIVRREAFDSQSAVMAKPSVGYVMDGRYLLNIDEPRDMVVAEALVAAWQERRL